MFNIIKTKKYWFIFSGILTVLSIVSISVFGLRLGIDYTGGSILKISSSSADKSEIVQKELQENNISNYQIKPAGSDELIIKTAFLDKDAYQKISSKLAADLGNYKEISYDTIGPTVGKDLENKSILAVILSSLGIILYIAYAFRRLPRPLSSWKFGVSAVIALIHDLLITTGFVSILSHFFSWMEVDVLFITALLTIMGFSVHDTIVVYDRLRENFIRNPHQSIEKTAQNSVNQTIARSINTSLSTVLVLVALIILGSGSILHFTLTLAFGIVIGTYSSIFIATLIMITWHNAPKKVGER